MEGDFISTNIGWIKSLFKATENEQSFPEVSIKGRVSELAANGLK
jgi:hypothetical protein